MAFLGNVEYKPDEPIDCLENQSVREEFIPSRFKAKQNWKKICEACPFRDY